jgi:hypothetical protein
MSDLSPKLNSPDRPRGLPREDADRLLDAASALKLAMDDLTREIVTGSVIGRAGARDRFEIALAGFASLIDRTAE